jgi:hypothetical protein
LSALLSVAIVFPGLIAGSELPTSIELDGTSDLYGVGLPLRTYGGRAMAEGRLPLWHPSSYGGLPLAAIPEAVPYYPLSAPFYVFFDPTRATAWTLALHLILAGWGAGLLAGRLGANAAGRAMTAVVIAVGLWLPNHLRQMNLMQSAAWVPWAWLALDRALERPGRRGAAELGAAMGMLALAGHAQMLHHAAVALAAWAILRWPLIRGSGEKRPRAIVARGACVVGAAAIAVAIASPHLAPTVEMSRLADRSAMNFIDAHPKYLLTLLNPFAFGTPAEASSGRNVFFSAIYWEEAQYIGIVALAAAAMIFGWRRRVRRRTGESAAPTGLRKKEGVNRGLTPTAGIVSPLRGCGEKGGSAAAGSEELRIGRGEFGAPSERRSVLIALVGVAIASLVLAYAHLWSPADRLTRLIPGASLFRFPHRYLWFFTLSAAIASGLGVTQAPGWLNAWRRQSRPIGSTAFGTAALLLAALDLTLAVRILCPIGDAAPFVSPPATLDALAAAGARPDRFGERVVTYDGAAIGRRAFHAAAGWMGPLQIQEEASRFLRHQLGGLWGWESVRGHVGLAPGWTARAIGDQHFPGSLVWLDELRRRKPDIATPERWARWGGLLGGRWAIAAEALDAPNLRAVGVVRGEWFDAHLYENVDWAGGAWIARETAAARSDADAQGHLFVAEGDYRDQAVFVGEPPVRMNRPEGRPKDRIEVCAATPEKIDVEYESETAGYLVLNLNYHPRWRVSINGGAPVQPLRMNLTQTAALAPAGRHRVELRYSGALERVAIRVAAIGWLIAALLWVSWRRRGTI